MFSDACQAKTEAQKADCYSVSHTCTKPHVSGSFYYSYFIIVDSDAKQLVSPCVIIGNRILLLFTAIQPNT